jgi:hypothetical protein
MTTTPAAIAQTVTRFATMRRIRNADAPARYLAARRADAARNGYRGPLTRAELAAQASLKADREQMRAILHMH